jgi:hypothetical protein
LSADRGRAGSVTYDDRRGSGHPLAASACGDLQPAGDGPQSVVSSCPAGGAALRSGGPPTAPGRWCGGAFNRAWLGCTSPPARRGRRPGGARASGRQPGHRRRRRASAIATLVERATRFVMLVALPEGRVSEHVVSQLAAEMADLPERLRRSLTWDQGVEMARHRQFTVATDCPVYFCDPHSPGSAAATKPPTACYAGATPKARPTSAPSPRPTSSCLRVVTHCPATTSTQGRSESGWTESCASGLGCLA